MIKVWDEWNTFKTNTGPKCEAHACNIGEQRLSKIFEKTRNKNKSTIFRDFSHIEVLLSAPTTTRIKLEGLYHLFRKNLASLVSSRHFSETRTQNVV